MGVLTILLPDEQPKRLKQTAKSQGLSLKN